MASIREEMGQLERSHILLLALSDQIYKGVFFMIFIYIKYKNQSKLTYEFGVGIEMIPLWEGDSD